MKKRISVLLLAVCLLLTGCASLLEREYTTAEPHSSKFWESETAGTLRATNYQDVVNDLMLLVGERRESATLRLYDFEDGLSVTETLEKATAEVQQETPLGAYAVLYITYQAKEQGGFHEVQLQIGYRRTAEQIGRVINATTTEAIYTLLAATLDTGRNELAVRVGYWNENGPTEVDQAVRQLREDRGLQDAPGWTVNYYPQTGPAVLVEVLLDVPPPEVEPPPEEEIPPEEETPPEEPNAENEEAGNDAPEEPNAENEEAGNDAPEEPQEKME